MSYNLKHWSLLTTLLLTSSMVYAGWVAYDYNDQTQVYESIPTSSCLEKLCERGCVEDASTGDAHCCPSGTNTANTGGEHPDYALCKCPENQEWDEVTSKCIGICENPLNPYWNGFECVECLEDVHCEGRTDGYNVCDSHDENATWACLGMCPEQYGVVLVIDRTSSLEYSLMTGTKGGTGIRRQEAFDRAISHLKIYPDIYYAIYEDDASRNGNAKLDWGKYSFNEIKDAIFNYKWDAHAYVRGTQFKKAFNSIKELCYNKEKLIILWFTDGELNTGNGVGTAKTDVQKAIENLKGCAKIYMISPVASDKKTYGVSKHIELKNFRNESIEEFSEMVENNARCVQDGIITTLIGQEGQKLGLAKCSGNNVSECICKAGEYVSKGRCYSCTDGTYRTTTKDACFACPTGTRMWREGGGTYNICIDCNDSENFDKTFTKEECERCPNRYFKKNSNNEKGACSLCPSNSHPNADHNDCICNEGYYMSNGACYSCTDKSVRKTTEQACYATCPKDTRMWSKYNGYNYCFDCNYASGINAWFTKEECNHCPNRYFKDGKCSLCPKGQMATADGTDCE